MSLKNEICDVIMTRNDNIASYFMRISQLSDQIQVIDEKELVTTSLNGLPKSWDSFATGIYARKDVPKFHDLWIACTQEESRLILRGNI